ncbi:hypothetical protein DCAR_0312402 [Daucus carota subsp. sativus]|uniref:DM2 domain-containing protein n=1 Tax=Daucus carota subsp. sativus TaxID=79200 RepID=A0AAF1AUM6_DAUCS|nr:hypothetical protein DCAR_0312402 [Daucus carota subsp. sativus]
MVSNSELVKRLHEILSTSDLNTTTTGIVRRKLEEELGVSLSDKKAFIREQVDLYLQSHFEQQQEEEPNQEQQVEQEQETEEQGEEEEEQEQVEQEEEETEEQEEDGSGDEKAPLTRTRPKKQKKKVKRKGGGGGFAKVCSLSPELQNFTGVSKLPRTEVVKQLWSYIKENNLQDPSDRRNIICDDSLRVLFNVDSINMFQMNKALAKHIRPLDSDDSDVPKRKEKVPKRKEKRQKSCDTEEVATIPLSDALVKFLGTGETSLSRSDVIKRIWEYINQNNLQDPFDTGRIISDEKLKELFEVDTFNGLAVTKILKSHFVKAEK